MALTQLAEGPESRDRIALASGLTVAEAHAAGMLPYQIITASRKGDPLTYDQARQALTDMVRTAQPFAQRMLGEELTAPPPQDEEEARQQDAEHERSEGRPSKGRARTQPSPSPNGGFRPRGAVPRWLHQHATQARMAALRWPQGRPGSG